MKNKIIINGEDLTINDIVEVARKGIIVELAEDAKEKIKKLVRKRFLKLTKSKI